MNDLLIFVAGTAVGLLPCIPLILKQKKLRAAVKKQSGEKDYAEELRRNAAMVARLEQSEQRLTEAKKMAEEREMWLLRTLKSIGDAVIVTDSQGRAILMNAVAERILNISAKDAINKPHEEIFRIVGARDNEPRPSPVGRALRTGAIVELASNTDLISHTGERYHISDSVAPILDEQQKVIGAVLVFRDVTEEYQNRAALRDAVNDWEMASKIGGIASFRINYKTRAATGSKRLAEFWPVHNGVAAAPEEWVLPEDLGQGQAIMANVASGKIQNTFYQYRARKDGKIRHYRIYGTTDSEHPGDITGIIQDMTDALESENRLQNTREMWTRLIDALPLNYFAKDADHEFRYTHCNKRFAEFVGRPMEEIVGKTDLELFGTARNAEHINSDDRAIMEAGVSRNCTESAQTPDHKIIQFQTVKMPCLGLHNEHLLIGVSIDITELINLSRNQEAIRQGLEILVNEGDVNEGIERAMKSVCEYIGVSHSYILHIDTKQRMVSCVREYCQPGRQKILSQIQDIPFSAQWDWAEHFSRQCFLNIPDLQDMTMMKRLGPIYGEMIKEGNFRSLYCHRLIIDDQFWGYVGFAYADTVRILSSQELDFVQSAARFIELMIRHKRTQTELLSAIQQAREAEKAKSSFLATMSHEIRTPLNAVIGFAELLKDDTLPKSEQKDYLNDISIAGNALLALINDILDLSKLEAGKMQFSRTPTDFAELLGEVMLVFQQKLKEKQVESRIDIHDLPILRIDPLRFRQILFNLIGNAVKFTDSGSITVYAGFTPDRNHTTGTLRFAVQDTGCGISKEDAQKLFQPFEQSKTMLGTKAAGKGTGLGLSLVRRMLDIMNGKIELASTVDVGSVFTVTIRGVEYTEKGQLPPPGTGIQPEVPAALPVSRVLLVDDVDMNRKVMRAMLHKLGVEAVTAGNAQEALAALDQQQFDVMLTDMWMPGMCGMELAEKIRRENRFPQLKIVVLTADTETGSQSVPSIFDAALNKPVSMGSLRRTLEKIKDK